MLRTYPLEAGLPPGFATLDEVEQGFLFGERFKAWFSRDALREPACTVVKHALSLGLGPDRLRTLAAALEEKHDLLRPDTTWPTGEPLPALPVALSVGTRLLAVQDWVAFAHDGTADPLVQAVAAAQSSSRQMLEARTEDDALAALLGLGKLRAWVEHPERWNKLPDRRHAGWAIRSVLQAANTDVTGVLDSHRSATLAAVLELLRDFAMDGARQRRSDGVATFHDLLAWARDLLRDNAEVRHAVQARYQRMFIDEFQDTDPLQAEIAFYLAADESRG